MSKYKLIGDIWDNSKSKEYIIEKCDKIDKIYDYDKAKNLLDIDGYKRKIKLSRILGTNDTEGLNNIINKVKKCDDLYVEIDCKNEIKNPIIESFYLKRTQQVNYYLSSKIGKKCQIHYVYG